MQILPIMLLSFTLQLCTVSRNGNITNNCVHHFRCNQKWCLEFPEWWEISKSRSNRANILANVFNYLLISDRTWRKYIHRYIWSDRWWPGFTWIFISAGNWPPELSIFQHHMSCMQHLELFLSSPRGLPAINVQVFDSLGHSVCVAYKYGQWSIALFKNATQCCRINKDVATK